MSVSGLIEPAESKKFLMTREFTLKRREGIGNHVRITVKRKRVESEDPGNGETGETLRKEQDPTSKRSKKPLIMELTKKKSVKNFLKLGAGIGTPSTHTAPFTFHRESGEPSPMLILDPPEWESPERQQPSTLTLTGNHMEHSGLTATVGMTSSLLTSFTGGSDMGSCYDSATDTLCFSTSREPTPLWWQEELSLPAISQSRTGGLTSPISPLFFDE